MEDFKDYINPYIKRELRILKLDKNFTYGEGNYLYDNVGNRYLDFISSFGAVPFGFNYPEIWEVLEEIKGEKLPSIVQASISESQESVAEKLISLAPEGLKYVVFTNSGTEAVNIAIKMARLSSGKRNIIVAEGGYHGMQEDGFKYVPYGDIDVLEAELRNGGARYAGVMMEPIQGEGGIVIPPKGYLTQVSELCKKYGIVFIIDEIQTGLGRTGFLFACEEEGITPDILLIGKVLGGGIYPVNACLVKEEFYPRGFDLNYFSTFAGNNIACKITDRVIDIITRNNRELIYRIRENGERLLNELLKLRDDFPKLLKDARGKGYFLGLELEMKREYYPQSMLSILSEQNSLSYPIVSYLLNEKKIRLAPTLRNSKVIRLEPSFITEWKDCEEVINSFRDVLSILNEGNTSELLRPILDLRREELSNYTIPSFERESWDNSLMPSPDEEEGRFAFLVHPLDLANYYEFDPTLSALPEEKLELFSQISKEIIRPFVIGKAKITSQCGARAYGEFVNIPYTARQMIETPQDEMLEIIEDAIKLAVDRGARIVGLGAYTSVVTRGGTLLKGKYVPLTTGNSYTVVAGVDAIKFASEKSGIPLSEATASIVGATGAIGKALAILLGKDLHRIILVGNPAHPKSSVRRLRRVAIELCIYISKLLKTGWNPYDGSIGEYLSDLRLPSPDDLDSWNGILEALKENGFISITTDINSALIESQIIVTATNSPKEIIDPNVVRRHSIICDISRPPNVSPSIKKIRPDVLVIDGGIIEIPGRPSLGWRFGLDRGLAYACMSETMMLALEKDYRDMSLGSDLTLEAMDYFRELAKKHGFKVSQLRSFNRPISEEEWESYKTQTIDR